MINGISSSMLMWFCLTDTASQQLLEKPHQVDCATTYYSVYLQKTRNSSQSLKSEILRLLYETGIIQLGCRNYSYKSLIVRHFQFTLCQCFTLPVLVNFQQNYKFKVINEYPVYMDNL